MSVARKLMPNGNLSPHFYYRFMVNGRTHSGTTGCTTEREALKFEKSIIRTLRAQRSAQAVVENFRDVLAGDKRVALDEAFDRLLAKPRKRKMGDKQEHNKRAYWADFLAFIYDRYPGAKHLSDVTQPMAEEYIQHLRSAGKYVRGIAYRPKYARQAIAYENPHSALSPRTCNVYHKTLQQVFDVLSEDASLIQNPFRAIDALANESEQREAFTPDELKRIGEAARGTFLYPLFAIGISTGLREGDICTLEWSEVDLGEGRITRRMRKTGKTVRIPILPSLKQYLESELLPQRGDSPYVLPEHAEVYQKNPSGISYRVRKFLEGEPLGIATTRKVDSRSREVSIKDVHSLRHTFCYLAAVHGVPANIVQSIVGHVDPRITEMYMNHATDQMKREKLASMPNYLGLPEAAAGVRAMTVEERVAELLRRMTPDNMGEWPTLRDQALALLRPSAGRSVGNSRP
jgi:integrase